MRGLGVGGNRSQIIPQRQAPRTAPRPRIQKCRRFAPQSWWYRALYDNAQPSKELALPLRISARTMSPSGSSKQISGTSIFAMPFRRCASRKSAVGENTDGSAEFLLSRIGGAGLSRGLSPCVIDARLIILIRIDQLRLTINDVTLKSGR